MKHWAVYRIEGRRRTLLARHKDERAAQAVAEHFGGPERYGVEIVEEEERRQSRGAINAGMGAGLHSQAVATLRGRGVK